MLKDFLEKYGSYFHGIISDRQIKTLFSRIYRTSCEIAPLDTTTGNTQTIFRWDLEIENPHYASKENCEQIFTLLIQDLLGMLKVKGFEHRETLNVFSTSSYDGTHLAMLLSSSSRLGNSEIPIWYKKDPKDQGKHVPDNIFWMSPFLELYKLRTVVNKDILTKIQVKAYLTDRRQTGDYQTNREIRWETNPNSPQYASRVDCMKVEAKLVAEIFTFVGAPDLSAENQSLIQTILGRQNIKDSFQCPISGKPIFYNEFMEKVSNPVHGRSGFQVGHLNPLASTGHHTPDNTSWITDLGNRVQGESSLEEITNDIFFMADFHRKRLKHTWKEVEEIATKVEN